MKTSLLLVLTVVGLALASKQPSLLAPNNSKREVDLVVHFVPHSHDDVGWLKTIDEYYEQQVRYIYNTVMDALQDRLDRKFIVVEMAFFTMWWNEATEEQKNLVHQYVERGQVEFILGGWCMSDDAGPTYSGTTNQLSEGHRFLMDTFGVIPRYGWQIDPFGLSAYYPSLFAMMGFNGHIINRIHYTQKNEWKSSQHMEFIWRGSKSLGTKTEMFTHILDSHYSFPSGFDFEKDSPITDLNIASRASSLVTELRRRSAWYRSKHLFVPGGDDFRWQNAYVQYENWDKLIDYINERQDEFGIDIRYATLNDYFTAVNSENMTWPTYETDFFPYADNAESYWTGYFTSRPELKGYVRSRAALARNTEIFSMAADMSAGFADGDPTMLLPLRHANAEVQHHDGVTGTMKEPVLEMYNEHLEDGSDIAIELQLDAFENLLATASKPQLKSTSDSINSLTGTQIVPVIVSNSLGWDRETVTKIVVERTDLQVLDSNMNPVPTQISQKLVDENPKLEYNLYFAVKVPAAGFSTYYVTLSSRANFVVSSPVTNNLVDMENSVMRFNITTSNNGVDLTATNKIDGTVINVSQNIMSYPSYTSPGQPSGTYIFRAAGAARVVSSEISAWFVDGDLVQELAVKFNDAHFEVYRLFRQLESEEESAALDVQFRLGVLNPDNEVISRFSTSITNNSYLSSDNNGVEMHQRPNFSGKIEANYYPMVAQAFLGNANEQFTLLSERSHGVGTQAIGQVEVMLHRRCSMDDWRGMGEPLNDQYIVEPTLRLLFGSRSFSERIRPRVSLKHQYPVHHVYGSNVARGSWSYNLSHTVLRAPLPENVHLMSYKVVVASEPRWSQAILRLQHIYEVDSHSEMESPVEIDLQNIFNGQYSTSTEMDLSAVIPMSDVPRLQWQSTGAVTAPWYPKTKRDSIDEVITLNPMQIYTCLVDH